MVLFCFNQVGDGCGLFLPRLFDTLLGSLIAGLAVFLFLPDWQGRRLNKVLANTLTCNSIYLRQIMQQYAAGKATTWLTAWPAATRTTPTPRCPPPWPIC